MNKVFGYSKKGGKHWFKSDPYADKEIESIVDPEGGSIVSLPTAIPSPFARIDLVKTAFKNISKTPALQGYKRNNDVIASDDDEKLVSDSLDISEILFNIDNLKNKIRLIVWNRDEEITSLEQGSPEHRRLAETLSLYLNEDERTYNFDMVENFYLVECDHKIIGCTSPVTMFFASANDLSYTKIKFLSDRFCFDNNYTPLYKRDKNFQKYLYSLFRNHASLQRKMSHLNEYLKKNLEILNTENPALYNEIKTLKADDLDNDYSELDTGIAGQTIQLFADVTLRKRKSEDVLASVSQSDFVINSSKFNGTIKPLVLQNHFSKTNFRYFNGQWDSKIQVPYLDSEPDLNKRWLPGVSVQFPYLTVSDFLEPQLVRLIYPIHKQNFFDGNVKIEVGDDAKGYLLPLKPAFFDYFDSIDLLNSSMGKPQLEMTQGVSSSVKVTLRIPVKKTGEYISFERTYYSSSDSSGLQPEPEKNKGTIAEHLVGLTIFPFIKINDPDIKSYYRIQLIDRGTFGRNKNDQFTLQFFKNSSKEPVKNTPKTRRTKSDLASSMYFKLDEEFDYVQIKNLAFGGANAFIIPQWPIYKPGNKTYSFAVDFGTTNTHIEYKNQSEGPKAFDIKPNEVQIATLFDPNRLEYFQPYSAEEIYTLVDHEFVPKLIGTGEYRFPHRTVLAESFSLDIDSDTITLADFNIPFVYEKKEDKDNIVPNLKWAKREKGNSKRIHSYFENLMMLMRNKVIFGGGKLSDTRLIWFYPSSMTTGRKGQMESEWRTLFAEYFHSPHLTGITESLAPFYYFKGEKKLTGAYRPIVSIDIGGGTTDVVIFDKDQPVLLTSFKFAANTLFGDAYSEHGSAKSNGLIHKYYHHYDNLLDHNNYQNLLRVLRSIYEKNHTEDINTFLFSLENNPVITNSRQYSYNSLLSKDEDLKIIFLYFFSAIIYHIAQLMKYKKVPLPKHIIFSGTGSKILNIISPDQKALDKLSKMIFEDVYGEVFDESGISLVVEKGMPKEVTGKGGLMFDVNKDSLDMDSIRSVLTCIEDTGKDKLLYQELDDELKQGIVDHILKFNRYFIDLNQKYPFKANFNVSNNSLTIFEKKSRLNLREYMEEGLAFNKKMNEILTGELEETLFFYPLTGTINSLIGELAELSPIID